MAQLLDPQEERRVDEQEDEIVARRERHVPAHFVVVRVKRVVGAEQPVMDKGVQLEGLRIVGDPGERARKYYREGVDEIIYMDVVASLYGRNSLHDIVARTAREIFIPFTVGVGMRTLDDIKMVLRSGADKVSLNTAAIARPELVREAVRRAGGKLLLEAYGGISLESARAYAGAGVDFVSVGALTHSARSLDVSLEVLP